MPFIQAPDTWLTPKKISVLALHLVFHRFSPINCCLSVVLKLDKGDYPENSHVVFCPNKQRYFEVLLCVDLHQQKQIKKKYKIVVFFFFMRIYLWWSLCTLYLNACQVGVTVGDSGLVFVVFV